MVAKQGHVADIPDLLHWLNVDVPVRLSEQKGRVVLLNFNTYCSLHCLHVIADLDHLAKKYPDELVIVGIHGQPNEAWNMSVMPLFAIACGTR